MRRGREGGRRGGGRREGGREGGRAGNGVMAVVWGSKVHLLKEELNGRGRQSLRERENDDCFIHLGQESPQSLLDSYMAGLGVL